MQFSLLIANYNNGRFFKECYESILAQSYNNWEVIIVDDASVDDSVNSIKELIGDDSRFKLYQNQENRGCGYTKRKCTELASGDVCGFLDPDDALMPDALEKMINIHTQNPEVVLAYSTFYLCEERLENKSVFSKKKYLVNSEDILFFNLEYIVFHFTTFLKKAYDKTQGIDPFLQRAVDQDLIVRLAEVGKFYYLDEPLYLYRVHNTGMSALQKSTYWHWVVIMKAAERRNLNLEDLFAQTFVKKKLYDKLVKSMQESEALKIAGFFAPVIRLFKKKI